MSSDNGGESLKLAAGAETASTRGEQPAEQAKASPRSGVVPPPEHRFKPGQSGNPSGRAKGVSYPGDWLRHLAGESEDELRRIMADTGLPTSKRAAARQLVQMMDEDVDASGKAFDRVTDRTEGKPHQSQTVEHARPEDGATIRQRLLDKLGQRDSAQGSESGDGG